MKNVRALTAGLGAGLGAGAGLMYLFDPRRGRSRRRRLAAEASGVFHLDQKKLEKRGKHVLNRVRGAVSEAVAAVSPEKHVSDDVLVDRVRSRMGHVIPHPHEIEVHASNGVIRLQGKLAPEERQRLHKEIEAIPGVQCVHDGSKHRFPIAPGVLAGIAMMGVSLFRKTRHEALG